MLLGLALAITWIQLEPWIEGWISATWPGYPQNLFYQLQGAVAIAALIAPFLWGSLKTQLDIFLREIQGLEPSSGQLAMYKDFPAGKLIFDIEILGHEPLPTVTEINILSGPFCGTCRSEDMKRETDLDRVYPDGFGGYEERSPITCQKCGTKFKGINLDWARRQAFKKLQKTRPDAVEDWQ